MNKKNILIGIACFVIGFLLYFSKSSISSEKDAQKHIAGKTFIGTPPGEIWFKVSFTNNSYTLWSGVPHYEGWGHPRAEGSYSISKGRYSNTGETYYYVIIGEKNTLECFRFNISDQTLHYEYAKRDQVGIEMKKGDRNPWK